MAKIQNPALGRSVAKALFNQGVVLGSWVVLKRRSLHCVKQAIYAALGMSETSNSQKLIEQWKKKK